MTDNPEQLSVPPDGGPYHDQPQWRNDFPIDWPQDEFVERREFTKFLVLTSFAFVIGQAWIVFENLRRKRRGAPPVRRIARRFRASDLAGAMLVFAATDDRLAERYRSGRGFRARRNTCRNRGPDYRRSRSHDRRD